MDWVRTIAERSGAKVFIHLAQSQEEVKAAQDRGFKGAAYYLQACDVLGPNVVAAHCLYLQPGEVELLAMSHTQDCSLPDQQRQDRGTSGASSRTCARGCTGRPGY